MRVTGTQPGIFRGEQVSWNRGTSINISYTTYTKRAAQRKFFMFFLQDTLKNAFQMNIYFKDAHEQGTFFQNQGALCLFSKKRGDTYLLVACLSLFSLKRLIPSQHFNVGSTLCQRCGSTLKYCWSNIENEIKSDVRFSTLHNVDITSVYNDVYSTLCRRGFKVSTTLVKALSKSVGIVISADL